MSNSVTPPTKVGDIDFHCHLDRALTFDDIYFAHEGGMSAYVEASLKRKQNITGVLHRGLAYTEGSLRKRMEKVIKAKIRAGEVMLNAIVDTSADIGLRAFKIAQDLRAQYAEQMEINVSAYPIFGFKEWGSDRIDTFYEAAETAQFIVALPERDENDPKHEFTFEDNLALVINEAVKRNIPLQVHVDQTNTPSEQGTKRLIQAVRWLVNTRDPKQPRPEIWAIHMISPSCYNEEDFDEIIEGLKETGIGVGVCAIAAESMRQLYCFEAPIHSPIARVKRLLTAKIPVRLGTDNINDIFEPIPDEQESNFMLVRRERVPLATGLRFYNSSVFDKLFRGGPLNETDLLSVERSVDADREACREALEAA
ncbi:MAG TPA: hypothetical protein VMQ44_02665 [Candidatus Saccharimonadales bacterium]|nr:hypothetical protein [Candidatus Saccharimonadales bacterium]